MRRLGRAGALLVGASLLVGCATSDYLYLVKRDVNCSAFGGKPITFLREVPAEPHVEVALVEASGAVFVPITWEMLRLYMCREALSVVADAVFGLEQGHLDYSIGFTPLKLDWSNKKLSGVAVRYLAPGEEAHDVEAPALDEDGKEVSEPEEGAAQEPDSEGSEEEGEETPL